MKKIFLWGSLVLCSMNLNAHKDFIEGVVDHDPYLREERIKSFGDLRLIKKNELNQTMAYSQIKSKNLFGIGMPKGLNSELLITEGSLYEGKFDKHVYSAKKLENEDKDIAFLAYVNVEKWTSVKLPETITSFKEFEEILPILAKKAGINPDVPFPFILKSQVLGLKWFIVDGMGNGQPNHLSSFLRSRYIGGLDDVEIEGVGFYSKNHKGILSAPSTGMHIHFKTINGPLFVGHIDNEMTLSKETRILFPK